MVAKKKITYKCIKCGKEYSSRNFSLVQSDVYSGWDKHLPICRECLGKLYNQKVEEYEGNEEKAIHRLCMMFDLYYNFDAYKATFKGKQNNARILSYISKINLLPHKGKTYEDYLLENEKKTITINSVEEYIYENQVNESKDNDTSPISIETIDFFGVGFEEDDYRFLKDEYDDWTARHECNTKTQEEIFKSIAFNRWNKWKSEKDGSSTKDIDKQFLELLDVAKLQPKQNSNDATANSHTFGTLIQKWENEKPITEPLDEFKDVDKIGLYIDVFFKGHMAKMLNLKSAFSGLYERFIKKYTVNPPKYDDEEVDEALFEAIFGKDD